MGTLIELTSKVLDKMKAQADAEREAARIGSVGGSPNTLNIHEHGGDNKSVQSNVDQSIKEAIGTSHRVKLERDALQMKLEVVEKDHQKFTDISNAQVNMDRLNAELLKRYNFLLKNTTETDTLIHSKHVESGKEKKEGDMRALVHEAHDESRLQERKMKTIEKASK